MSWQRQSLADYFRMVARSFSPRLTTSECGLKHRTTDSPHVCRPEVRR